MRHPLLILGLLLGSMRQPLLIFGLLVATAMWCSGAGQKYKLSLVTFHTEGEETDNPKMIVPVKLGDDHRQYFFSKLPVFSDHDIAWFYPFTASDGVSFGAAFRFKEHAAIQLKSITLTNQGRLLGIRCSTAPLQAVLIDRPIDDGVVVIWSGLQQKHLQEFRKRFPHVDDYQQKTGPQFASPTRVGN
ncbi:MAG TPA: hypothetical protein PLA50_10975 [Bacteroidia bacterium]|nr:hypothetical protein [Bacteroidia bacterium]